MATYISAICGDTYWGAPDYAGKGSEVARDAYYSAHFTGLDAWESDRDDNANTGDDEIAEIVGTWASAGANFSITGWTNTPASITIQALGDARHDGIWGNKSGAYVCDLNGGYVSVSVNGCAITFDGIQFDQTGASYGIYPASTHDSGKITVNACLFRGSSGALRALMLDGDAEKEVTACVIFDEWDYGIRTAGGATVNIYHCSIETDNHGTGFRDGGGTTTLKNCAVFNNTDDFSGGDVIDYCASDDGDGDHAVAASGSDWDNEFNGWGTGNLTVKNTGNLYHAGVSGLGVSTDICGDSFDGSTPSIGADEYVAAGGETISVECSDGIAAADVPGGTLTIVATVADGMSGDDVPGGSLIIPAAASDGMTGADTAGGTLTISVSAADGMSGDDAPGGTYTLAGAIAEILGLSDLSGANITFQVTAADGVALDDSAGEGAFIDVQVTDGLGVSDLVAATLAQVIATADGLTLADGAAGTVTLAALAASGAVYSVTSGATINVVAVAADTVGLSDLISASIAMLIGATDGMSLSDVTVATTFLPTGAVRITVTARTGSVTITTKQGTMIATEKHGGATITPSDS